MAPACSLCHARLALRELVIQGGEEIVPPHKTTKWQVCLEKAEGDRSAVAPLSLMMMERTIKPDKIQVVSPSLSRRC